eukprot:s106_g43.t1
MSSRCGRNRSFRLLDMVVFRRSCTLECAEVPAVNLTRTTYVAGWSPTSDGVTFPLAPEELGTDSGQYPPSLIVMQTLPVIIQARADQHETFMFCQELLRKGMVNDATIVLGAQTNDSNLFLFRSHTKDGLDQPNDHPDGALKPARQTTLSYGVRCAEVLTRVGPKFVKQALKLYPADSKDGIKNVHQLGNVESDQMLCSIRRRASWFNQARPGFAFAYRFDYWYTGNSNCTAVPNFHLPYLGAAHQDEVTFVLGQPNFMEDGSCCGIWGLTTPDCPHLERCEACYAPSRFGHEGYRAYFNDKEWDFARTVGTFWTNVAGSGDPNCRDSPMCGTRLWPKFESGEVTQNIVLNASLPGGAMAEATPHGRPELCAFWDAVEEAKRPSATGTEPRKALYVSPLADPLIADKLLDRALKLLKKAISEKQTRRGVPECTKAMRKGQKGICFLAADIYPMDVFAHVPLLAEE